MRERRVYPFLAMYVLAIFAALILTIACSETDTGVTTKVKTKLAADDIVPAAQIDVTTRNHVVTLTGNVDSQEAKARAIELAKNTKGVTNVVDMIAVKSSEGTGDAPESNRTLGEAVDDAGITMRVKGKFLDDPDVKGLRIDVDTRDGVVFLTGSVASATEREKAVRLARETNGVRDVQANLTIKS